MYSRYGYVSFAFLLDALIHNEAANLGGRRVYGTEAEDVEENETAVVDEVLDRLAGEGEVCVGELGNVRDAVYAIDVGEDAGEGQIGRDGVAEGG